MAHNGLQCRGNVKSLVASSLGVYDALLRKLVDVVDVGHTKKGLKHKEEMPKRTEEKEKFLQKSALAVVPLFRPVVPLRR